MNAENKTMTRDEFNDIMYEYYDRYHSMSSAAGISGTVGLNIRYDFDRTVGALVVQQPQVHWSSFGADLDQAAAFAMLVCTAVTEAKAFPYTGWTIAKD